MFGPKPEAEPTTCSFSSSVNSLLQKTNDDLLLLAEDFYCSHRVTRSQLLPESVDQWADSMQQRLLGYQEEGRRFLSMSREEAMQQRSVLGRLLCSLPAVLICNHERRQEAELREVVGEVRHQLEEMLTTSEKEKVVCVSRLRASFSPVELQTLVSTEEQRQQQLLRATCSAHLKIQERVRVRGTEFVTSLVSLTEKLQHEFNKLLTPAGSDDRVVTTETRVETGSSTAEPPSSVATTSASCTTARCIMGHLSITEHRDAAMKRFQLLISSELSISDDDKRRQLSEQQTWNTHWRQEIHTWKSTHQQ